MNLDRNVDYKLGYTFSMEAMGYVPDISDNIVAVGSGHRISIILRQKERYRVDFRGIFGAIILNFNSLS
jgi:hypothetical protein